MATTHEVFNQPPALAGYDVADDPAMLDALRREGAGWAEDAIRELGRLAGSAGAQELGRRRTRTRPCCGRMTGSATASMRWSSTRPGMS